MHDPGKPGLAARGRVRFPGRVVPHQDPISRPARVPRGGPPRPPSRGDAPRLDRARPLAPRRKTEDLRAPGWSFPRPTRSDTLAIQEAGLALNPQFRWCGYDLHAFSKAHRAGRWRDRDGEHRLHPGPRPGRPHRLLRRRPVRRLPDAAAADRAGGRAVSIGPLPASRDAVLQPPLVVGGGLPLRVQSPADLGLLRPADPPQRRGRPENLAGRAQAPEAALQDLPRTSPRAAGAARSRSS